MSLLALLRRFALLAQSQVGNEIQSNSHNQHQQNTIRAQVNPMPRTPRTRR